jgi:hypothetical protein
MGQVCGGGTADVDLLEEEDEKKKDKKKDNRKRNSQLFALMDFIDATRNRTNHDPGGGELPPLDFSTVSCANANAQKQKLETGKIDPRAARANKVADGIAQGNMRVMREQVIGHFTTINSESRVGRGGEEGGVVNGAFNATRVANKTNHLPHHNPTAQLHRTIHGALGRRHPATYCV